MVFLQGTDNHFNYFLQPVPSWEYKCLTFYFWSGCCGVQNSIHCYFATLQHLTDVEDVKFVINYDYPNSSEDYIHRIGRTARSTKTGAAAVAGYAYACWFIPLCIFGTLLPYC